VFLEQEAFETLAERSEDELELLVEAEGYRECGSRLSCQVGFSRDLDGVTVTLAPEE
jgi:2Fe-2S ferredoxin